MNVMHRVHHQILGAGLSAHAAFLEGGDRQLAAEDRLVELHCLAGVGLEGQIRVQLGGHAIGATTEWCSG
jgi:hypothetical protein